MCIAWLLMSSLLVSSLYLQDCLLPISGKNYTVNTSFYILHVHDNVMSLRLVLTDCPVVVALVPSLLLSAFLLRVCGLRLLLVLGWVYVAWLPIILPVYKLEEGASNFFTKNKSVCALSRNKTICSLFKIITIIWNYRVFFIKQLFNC